MKLRRGGGRGGRPCQEKAGIEYVRCRHCLREYRVIGWSHLVRVHDYDSEHPIEDYKAKFGLKRAFSILTLRRMKDSLHAHFERQGRHWTRDRVKSEILRCKGRGKSLSWRVMHRDFPNLTWAARRLFRSWENAIRASGISYDQVREHRAWTSRTLIEGIKRSESAGERLNAGAMRRRDYGLFQAAIARWGTWAKALGAAGVDPVEARRFRTWNRASIVEAIRELGHHPGYRKMKDRDSGLLDAAERVYGTWKAAVQAAGMSYPKRNAPWKWPREKVLKEVRRRHRLGLSLRAIEIQRDCRGLGAAGEREFGTWPRAVAAAGVPYPKRRGGWKWPRERILREIRARARRGLSVRDTVMKRVQGGLWWAGYREFGTWRSAVEKAGIRYPSRVGE